MDDHSYLGWGERPMSPLPHATHAHPDADDEYQGEASYYHPDDYQHQGYFHGGPEGYDPSPLDHNVDYYEDEDPQYRQMTSGIGEMHPTPGSHRSQVASLYSVRDYQGARHPSDGFDQWLAGIPEPVDPAQRYRDELQSYPTAATRAARATMPSTIAPALSPVGEVDSQNGVNAEPSSGKTGRRWLPSSTTHDNAAQKRHSISFFSGAQQTPVKNQPEGYQQQQQQQHETTEAAQPSQDIPKVKTPNKLQKKRRLQAQEDQDDDNQTVRVKRGRFSTLARSFSRLGGRHSPPVPTKDDDQEEHQQQAQAQTQSQARPRPATALSRTFSLSRRRFSGLFRGGPTSATTTTTAAAASADQQQQQVVNATASGSATRAGSSNVRARPMSFHGFSALVPLFGATATVATATSQAGGGEGQGQNAYGSARSWLMQRDLIVHALPKPLDARDLESGNYRMQIALVGDATVGKSALINRFITNSAITEDYTPTTSRAIHRVLMKNCAGGVSCRVEIHDLPGGQEDIRTSYLTQDWYDAVVLCYSIGDPATLNTCKQRWIDDARSNTAGVPIFLAGLKSDRRGPALQLAFLQDNHVVTRFHGEVAAREIAADKYLECSSKDGKGVSELFYDVVNASLPRVIKNSRRSESRLMMKKKPDIIQGASRRLSRLFLSSSSSHDHDHDNEDDDQYPVPFP